MGAVLSGHGPINMASLSNTQFWYEVGMRVPAVSRRFLKDQTARETFSPNTDINCTSITNRHYRKGYQESHGSRDTARVLGCRVIPVRRPCCRDATKVSALSLPCRCTFLPGSTEHPGKRRSSPLASSPLARKLSV